MSELKSQLESPAGRELKNWLLQWARETESITNVKEYANAEEQAFEVKVVKRVNEAIKDKLSEIITIVGFARTQTPSQDKINRAKEFHGLPKI